MFRLIKPLFALLVLTMAITPCFAANLESTEYSGQIEIDGSAREWNRDVYWFEDEALRIGLQNDSTTMFVLIATKEIATASVFQRGGLKLNISSKQGGFGIKIAGNPIGDRPERRSNEQIPSEKPKPEWSIGNEFVYIDKKKNEIILGRDFAAKEGLIIETAFLDDDFAIEMAIPLTKGYFAISPRLPETLTMKIESSFEIEGGMPKEGFGESSRGEGRGRPSGGDFGEGRQAPSGGGPPGGGPMGSGPSQSTSSIKLKFKVALSSSPENKKVVE